MAKTEMDHERGKKTWEYLAFFSRLLAISLWIMMSLLPTGDPEPAMVMLAVILVICYITSSFYPKNRFAWSIFLLTCIVLLIYFTYTNSYSVPLLIVPLPAAILWVSSLMER